MQGFIFIGPALHYWYGTLGRLVTAKGTAGGQDLATQAMANLAREQLVLGGGWGGGACSLNA